MDADIRIKKTKGPTKKNDWTGNSLKDWPFNLFWVLLDNVGTTRFCSYICSAFLGSPWFCTANSSLFGSSVPFVFGSRFMGFYYYKKGNGGSELIVLLFFCGQLLL